MSRRWWFALPLAAGAGVVSLFATGILPPGGAEPTGQSRPDAAAGSVQQSSPEASPSALATSPSATATVTTTPSRTASKSPAPSQSVRAQSVPSIARVPISSVRIKAAVRSATSRGYQAGVAVVDTSTGKLWVAGDYNDTFAAESVVKVFIATRLLATRQLTGDTADTAYRMITQSDDGAADALYGLAGGDEVVPWIAKHYGIPGLGSPPTKVGWWSNNHITAVGMARFYAKVKADPLVWPWLSKAMHRATEYGSDGTYQFFGLKQADRNAAIKQGWGQDDDDWAQASDFNSTGYVNSDRYAVVILVKGPPWEYNSGTPAAVTRIAKTLMPGGVMRL
ncbi:hypothetical protein [Jatrophihabitans sp.]|jgi:hypothetical protein|uniref:hypothetical protein n=1 Tax=Jatrophihabitans sp. TaxID=1932789 RepID=UPI002EED9C18